jgi:hypothetical protein
MTPIHGYPRPQVHPDYNGQHLPETIRDSLELPKNSSDTVPANQQWREGVLPRRLPSPSLSMCFRSTVACSTACDSLLQSLRCFDRSIF